MKPKSSLMGALGSSEAMKRAGVLARRRAIAGNEGGEEEGREEEDEENEDDGWGF